MKGSFNPHRDHNPQVENFCPRLYLMGYYKFVSSLVFSEKEERGDNKDQGNQLYLKFVANLKFY